MLASHLKRAIVFFIFVLIIGTPLFYLKAAVYPYIIPKAAFFQAFAEIIFALWLGLALLEPAYRPRRNPLLLAGGIFLGVLLLTSLAGFDFHRSFWSTQERMLGIFSFLHFGALFLVLHSLRREFPWQKLLHATLATAAVVGALAILQLSNHSLLLEEYSERPGSTFGNPTFLAGYILLHVFLGIYLLLDDVKRQGRFSRWSILSLGAVLFGLAVLLATETRGDLLGAGAGFFALLALFALRPPRLVPPATNESDRGTWLNLALWRFLSTRRPYAVILGATLILVPVFWFTRTSPVWDKVPGLDRFRTISLDDPSLMPRFIALTAAKQAFIERPLTGWGWENFNVAFNKYFDPRALRTNYQETRFDKPHNLVMEYLVTGGLPLLLAFGVLFGTFLWRAWRNRNELWGSIALAAGAAYLVRSLFVFDTLGPLLLLTLFMAYNEEQYLGAATEEPVWRRGFTAAPAWSWGIVIAGVIFAYIANGLTVQASRYQFWGFKYFVHGRPAQAVESFRNGVNTMSPYSYYFKRDYATTVADAYFYNPDLVPKADARAAVTAMAEAAAAHPADAYNHYVLVDMYNQLSDLDPAEFARRAEAEAEIALRQSPRRQEVYFALAKTKSLQGDNAAALKLMEYALSLDPEVADAHFNYGLLSFATGDFLAGDQAMRRALELGRRWKNHYEPAVVANFYANAGEIERAVELYRISLTLRDDLETRAKLGVALYFAGELAEARTILGQLMKETDLTLAPGYPELRPILAELGLDVGPGGD